MTIEFRTDGSGNIMTPVSILNMGSGFAYGDVITINDTVFWVATASYWQYNSYDETRYCYKPAWQTAITVPGGCSQAIHLVLS